MYIIWQTKCTFEAYFPTWWSLVCQLFDLYPEYLMQMLFISVLKWHSYADSYPNRGSKKDTLAAIKWSYFFEKKNVVLKLQIQHEGHVGAIFLIYILTIYRECLLCQFFSRDKRTHAFYPNMGPKRTNKLQKNSHLSLKNVVSFKLKVTCMPIAYFAFWLFSVNAFLFRSLVVAYVFTCPS